MQVICSSLQTIVFSLIKVQFDDFFSFTPVAKTRGHPSAASRAQDRESTPAKTDVLTTEPCHQLAMFDVPW